jgi:hypothetical protein
MHGDIWELPGKRKRMATTPVFGTAQTPFITVESTAAMPVDWWSLAIIIFIIWLGVRNL